MKKVIYDSEAPEAAVTPAVTPVYKTKRNAVSRIVDALQEKGYRCTQTGLANYAQNAFGSDETKVASGSDFSLWHGANGVFVLYANEETQSYELFKATDFANKLDDDIALL